MKKTRLGMYSLAVGAFALAITGCGGKKEESSEAPAPAASAPAGKTVDPATAGEITGIGEARRRRAEDEDDQHGGRTEPAPRRAPARR